MPLTARPLWSAATDLFNCNSHRLALNLRFCRFRSEWDFTLFVGKKCLHILRRVVFLTPFHPVKLSYTVPHMSRGFGLRRGAATRLRRLRQFVLVTHFLCHVNLERKIEIGLTFFRKFIKNHPQTLFKASNTFLWKANAITSISISCAQISQTFISECELLAFDLIKYHADLNLSIILWRIDPLLSDDSVSSGRCW
jgi:hypothetical protein